MAKRVAPGRSVGIKELKDRASSLIDEVQRSRRSIVITKNGREVARIIPKRTEPGVRLKELGLIALEPREPWSTLELKPLNVDATKAIQAIVADREDG